MPVSERAKIFIPFEPLRGFRQALRERERAQLVQPRADLTENQMEELSREMAALAPGDMVRVTHYVDDHYRGLRDQGVRLGLPPAPRGTAAAL